MGANIIGRIQQPSALVKFGTVEGGAIGVLINLIFNIMIVGAGIFALFNFILAGYMFLSAGDDPKKVEGAWAKIYLSIIGLIFAAGALVLAGVFGILIFGDANFLIKPSIPVPGP